MLVGANETLCAQQSIPDSCICYTDAQDIRCLECLINADKRASQLENVQDQLSIRVAELELAGQLITEQAEVITDLQANLAESERKRGLLKKLLEAAALVIIGETVILLL